jgi:hypothetical protein
MEALKICLKLRYSYNINSYPVLAIISRATGRIIAYYHLDPKAGRRARTRISIGEMKQSRGGVHEKFFISF